MERLGYLQQPCKHKRTALQLASYSRHQLRAAVFSLGAAAAQALRVADCTPLLEAVGTQLDA